MLSFDDPMAVFSFALNSKHSKKKYPQRFKTFLTFLGYNGVLKEDAMDATVRFRSREPNVCEIVSKAVQDRAWVPLRHEPHRHDVCTIMLHVSTHGSE